MACRIPIVTTPVGSIGEIVRDGHTGLFVQPQSADSLRAALARLYAEPVLREQLAQTGYEEAQSRFGAASMLDKMERIFLAVAAGSA
jgi:glycosyltransferase involved in cell wall biosynthesis